MTLYSAIQAAINTSDTAFYVAFLVVFGGWFLIELFIL